MVYFSESRKRTPAQKVMRRIIGAVAVTLIIFALSQIPYEILREERFRLYGETRTTGIVTEVHKNGEADAEHRYTINYKYIDNDGFARETTAPLPYDIWVRYRPGSRIEVIYVRSKPGLARIEGEIEPGFKVWLRGVLD